MFDINQFKNLSKEQKVSRLISILEILKWDWDLFDDLYQLVETLKDNISNDFLDNLYEIIASAIKNLNDSKLKKDIEKMDKIRQRLKKLKEIEEKNNDNPEEILQQINNI